MSKLYFPALTGMRFLAALSILILHTVAWCLPFNDATAPLALANWIGVYGMPLFFVLSGFVIHYNYYHLFQNKTYPQALRIFFAARFARIYPLYFFFFIFGVSSDFILSWVGWATREFVDFIIFNATLTQSWFYIFAIHDRLILNHGFGLAWSISSEFFFYIAYCLFVFKLLRIYKVKSLISAIVITSIIAFVVLMLINLNFDSIENLAGQYLSRVDSQDKNFQASLYRWFFYFSPYGRIWEFIIGCLVAQLYIIFQDKSIDYTEMRMSFIIICGASAYLFIFGAIYAASVWVPTSLGQSYVGAKIVSLIQFYALNFGCAPALGAIIFCLVRYKTRFSSFLETAPIVWLGDISYSVYAVHTWTIRPFIRPSVSLSNLMVADAFLRIALAILFTIIVASATHKLIELPCRRYFRARAGI